MQQQVAEQVRTENDVVIELNDDTNDTAFGNEVSVSNANDLGVETSLAFCKGCRKSFPTNHFVDNNSRRTNK